jgi:hypothetical protein
LLFSGCVRDMVTSAAPVWATFTKNLGWRLDPLRAIAGPTAMWRADVPRVELEVQVARGTTER